jgi:hypothetical protein
MVGTQAGVKLEVFDAEPASGTYRARYDTEAMSPSMGVIATLSKVTGRCPTGLEPLQKFVDTDALDEFLQKQDGADEDVSVTFHVRRHTITVYGSGRITVTSSDENGASNPMNGTRV